MFNEQLPIVYNSNDNMVIHYLKYYTYTNFIDNLLTERIDDNITSKALVTIHT